MMNDLLTMGLQEKGSLHFAYLVTVQHRGLG